MSHMSFELLATDGRARRGRLTFPRGAGLRVMNIASP